MINGPHGREHVLRRHASLERDATLVVAPAGAEGMTTVPPSAPERRASGSRQQSARRTPDAHRSRFTRLLLGVDLPGARCAGQAPDFDDVVPGETPADRAARLEACRAVCTACPARPACRAASQALPKGCRSGVWAGKAYGERGTPR
ncbi:hypothetical protein GCM10010178_62400 [Lentzea flava]|uniref:4Fe-4S Wbl-type domain-containing protein n=1 Tax=Lentzea flava TaxID=103732 RepID=A0ABQ2V1P4_9PSEU|nr:hypothetical protein GCM10010178_62400 [Lentzea flava]